MTTNAEQQTTTQEPVGLVISLGSQPEVTPRFWAYVWSETPETKTEEWPARRAA